LRVLEPTLFIVRANALGATDTPGKCDHGGNIKPHRAVTTPAQYAVFPNNRFYIFQKGSVHPAILFIQFTQRIEDLERRHVLRITVMLREKKAAFRTEAAMHAM
jgi:hypothetical protein